MDQFLFSVSSVNALSLLASLFALTMAEKAPTPNLRTRAKSDVSYYMTIHAASGFILSSALLYRYW